MDSEASLDDTITFASLYNPSYRVSMPRRHIADRLAPLSHRGNNHTWQYSTQLINITLEENQGSKDDPDWSSKVEQYGLDPRAKSFTSKTTFNLHLPADYRIGRFWDKEDRNSVALGFTETPVESYKTFGSKSGRESIWTQTQWIASDVEQEMYKEGMERKAGEMFQLTPHIVTNLIEELE